jgi:hypothetical protein
MLMFGIWGAADDAVDNSALPLSGNWREQPESNQVLQNLAARIKSKAL